MKIDSKANVQIETLGGTGHHSSLTRSMKGLKVVTNEKIGMGDDCVLWESKVVVEN